MQPNPLRITDSASTSSDDHILTGTTHNSNSINDLFDILILAIEMSEDRESVADSTLSCLSANSEAYSPSSTMSQLQYHTSCTHDISHHLSKTNNNTVTKFSEDESKITSMVPAASVIPTSITTNIFRRKGVYNKDTVMVDDITYTYTNADEDHRYGVVDIEEGDDGFKGTMKWFDTNSVHVYLPYCMQHACGETV